MRETNKKSKLVFDMKLVRKLLKMNAEMKYCPYCGVALEDQCECHKNIIIDVKPLRDGNGETVAVFANNEAFQSDFDAIMEEYRLKKESEAEQ
jgi:hypothetical protein